MYRTEITHYKSPIGILEIKGSEKGVESLKFIDAPTIINTTKTPNCLKETIIQLKAYFKGDLKKFDVPLNTSGTDFQQHVWESLQNIPYGTTKSYLQQSKIVGNPKAIRAVASANSKNPILLIIPCHRIIGSNNALTGYAGGIWRKQWLLEHEGALPKQSKLF